jgi:hypothetical protein
MFCRRKPQAALAAVTVALAVAVPAANASAATTAARAVDPQVCQLLNVTRGPFGPTQFIGGASLSNVLANAGATVSCPPPAPQPSLLPQWP